jgi:hypothetical protein
MTKRVLPLQRSRVESDFIAKDQSRLYRSRDRQSSVSHVKLRGIKILGELCRPVPTITIPSSSSVSVPASPYLVFFGVSNRTPVRDPGVV